MLGAREAKITQVSVYLVATDVVTRQISMVQGSTSSNTQWHSWKGCAWMRLGDGVIDKTTKVIIGGSTGVLVSGRELLKNTKGGNVSETPGKSHAWMEPGFAVWKVLVGAVRCRENERFGMGRQLSTAKYCVTPEKWCSTATCRKK